MIQLVLKDSSSHSWFVYVQEIFGIYNFSSVFDLTDSALSKTIWKAQVKKTVNSFWMNKIREMTVEKSTLKNLDPRTMIEGSIHNIWDSAGFDTIAIKKANIKARLLSGVYPLQINRSRFNKTEVSAICPLCNKGIEDVEHFVLTCEFLDDVREPFLRDLKILIHDFDEVIETLIYTDTWRLMLVILDISNSRLPIKLQTDLMLGKIEAISRGLIYALHRKRCAELDIVMR